MGTNQNDTFNSIIQGYKWVINNFWSYEGIDSVICSPIFNGNWSLRLYPFSKEVKDFKEAKGATSDTQDKGYISLWFGAKENFIGSIRFTFSIYNGDYEQIDTRTFELNIENGDNTDYIDKFLSRNKVKQHAPDGKFIIVFQTIIDPQHSKETVKSLVRLKEFDDFEKILDNAELSDVVFNFPDGQKIHSHKIILMARSDSFRAMFSTEMEEKSNGSVDIEDIGYDIFKELLRFLYVGKTSEIKPIAKDLVKGASKYFIVGLKKLCENSLCDSIDIDNVLEYLHLADTYELSLLKTEAIEFIKQNVKELVKHPQFSMFGQLSGDLICEVTREIVNQYVP